MTSSSLILYPKMESNSLPFNLGWTHFLTTAEEVTLTTIKGVMGCTPKIHVHLEPVNEPMKNLFRNRVYADVIKLKRSHEGGS